jgi:hypothetical protein
MPNASSECSGTYSNDPKTTGCKAGLSSFELWQQYSYNATTKAKWAGWQVRSHAASLSMQFVAITAINSQHVHVHAFVHLSILSIAQGQVGVTMPPAWASELKRYYYAAVSHTDEMMGAVIAAVRTRGEEQRTIIAVVGESKTMMQMVALVCPCLPLSYICPCLTSALLSHLPLSYICPSLTSALLLHLPFSHICLSLTSALLSHLPCPGDHGWHLDEQGMFAKCTLFGTSLPPQHLMQQSQFE